MIAPFVAPIVQAAASPSPVFGQTPPPGAAPTAGPPESPGPPALPGSLSASPAAVQMNPAQERVVTIGSASGALVARLDDPVATLTIDQTAHSVTLAASNLTGSTTLHVTDAAGASVDVPLRVAFNAGTIVPQATLRITGSAIDAQWLAAKIAQLLNRVNLARPGSTLTNGAPSVAPAAPPAPGSSATYVFPVNVTGEPNFFDVQGTTAVQVENVATAAFAPATLLYDDDPERIAADGPLFRATVSLGSPARLYYYHDLAPGDSRRFAIVLSAQSEKPTQVQLVDAPAGPNADVMSLGNAVTRSFLDMKPRNQGTIVDLTDAPFAFRDQLVAPGQGIAGNVDVRVLSGGPVQLAVVAISPGADYAPLLTAPLLAGDGHRRTGTFVLGTFGANALAYAARGPDVNVVLGDREPTLAAADPAATGHDYGDYGVWHDITFTLTNPSLASARAYLYFRPIGGVARASFTIDGAPFDLGCVRLPVPYQIAAYALAPGATQTVRLATMTDGGSNYPVEIGATGTAPAPAAPPIASPDGCFPKPGTT